MRALIIVAALALTAAPGFAQPANPPTAPAPATTVYVITYKAGPTWKAGVPMSKQAIGSHAAYMRKLYAEGRMYAAGPTLDIDGGVVLLRAADLAEARALMAADPAVTTGLFVGEVREWRLAFSSGEPLAPKAP